VRSKIEYGWTCAAVTIAVARPLSTNVEYALILEIASLAICVDSGCALIEVWVLARWNDCASDNASAADYDLGRRDRTM
jgi:Flp pilus assembly pilin Flp